MKFHRLMLMLMLAAGVALAEKKQEDRKKAIDFEGDVVEGLNKQPLDSLNQINEGDSGRRKNHLYRRTKSFREENRELVRDIAGKY